MYKDELFFILLSYSLGFEVKTKYLGIGDRRQPLFFQFIDGLLVFPEVELGTHQNDGHLRTVVPHLGVPLGPHVLETGGVHQGEADQENVLQRILITFTRRIYQIKLSFVISLRLHSPFEDMKVASVCRSPPDPQCPTVPG